MFNAYLLLIFVILTVSYKIRLTLLYSLKIGVLIITYFFCFRVFAFGGEDWEECVIVVNCAGRRNRVLSIYIVFLWPPPPRLRFINISCAGIVDLPYGKHCRHTHMYRVCAPRIIIIDNAMITVFQFDSWNSFFQLYLARCKAPFALKLKNILLFRRLSKKVKDKKHLGRVRAFLFYGEGFYFRFLDEICRYHTIRIQFDNVDLCVCRIG